MKYIVGIDEAGRGPLAGPVAVGAVALSPDFDWSQIEGVRDSKKLSEKKREEIFERARELQKKEIVRFTVCTSSALYIDRYGIVPAIKRALAEALSRLEVEPSDCAVLLDGSLQAPAQYKDQETIVRGDDTEPIISLASIVAKVTRDRLMRQLAAKYPAYGFEVHKGYGTASHRRKIAIRGLSGIHRASFCTRLPIPPNAV
ncbi:ribonuclease HII [Candidatus Kaiserbacteria bacterium]|nr:ribonuclease HII [Candidatus Kaiserbacteria bacterium]